MAEDNGRRTWTRLSSADRKKRDDKLVKMVAAGKKTYAEIATEFGLTRARVDQIVREHEKGIEARENRAKAKLDRRVKVIEDAIDNGFTYAEIAKKHGHGQNYWRNVAQAIGREKDVATKHNRIIEREDEILKLVDEGLPQKEIAAKLGVAQSVVSAVSIKNGRRRRLTGDELTKRNEEIRADLAAGMSKDEIAKKYDLSAASVYQVMRTLGLVTRRRGAGSGIESRNEEIARRIKQGETKEELAAEYDLSPNTIAAIATRVKSQNKKSHTTKNQRSKRNDSILDDYKGGLSYSKIADKNKVSISTVDQVVRAAGLEGGRKRGRPKKA